MGTDQNATLVRRYFEECLNRAGGPDQQRALAVLDELLTPDFVMQFNSRPDAQARRGLDQLKKFVVGHASSFVNDRWTINALVAEGDQVACWWRIQATDAASGKPIDLDAADFYRVRDGRLAELRRFLDFDTLNQQRPRAEPR